MIKLFIRNDDLREKLDSELIKITELVTSMGACISHAVEPANVSKEVAEWLLSVKQNNPNQIEIIQHGYDHNIRKLYPYGSEFGTTRSFESQYNDLKLGMEKMDDLFGDAWSRIMAFPYGTYNQSTLDAVEKLEYRAITSSVDFTFLRHMKDIVGQLFLQDFVLKKRVSYHGKKRSKYRFYDLGTSVNIIKKYKGYAEAEHFTFEELVEKIIMASKHTQHIGVLLHHRFHTNQLELINEILRYCKENSFKFFTIDDFLNYNEKK